MKRKPEYPEGTHTAIGRTCKFRTERPCPSWYQTQDLLAIRRQWQPLNHRATHTHKKNQWVQMLLQAAQQGWKMKPTASVKNCCSLKRPLEADSKSESIPTSSWFASIVSDQVNKQTKKKTRSHNRKKHKSPSVWHKQSLQNYKKGSYPQRRILITWTILWSLEEIQCRHNVSHCFHVFLGEALYYISTSYLSILSWLVSVT